MKKESKLNSYEDKIINSMANTANRITYCKVCGLPIEFGNNPMYEMEMLHQIHYRCLPIYNAKINAKK